MKTSQTTRFEVRCPSCRVSFPVGTRNCIHCGARTTSEPLGATPSVRERAPDPDGDRQGRRSVIDFGRDAEPYDDGDDDMDAPRTSIFRRSITLIWVLMLIGFSVVRSCMEGGQP